MTFSEKLLAAHCSRDRVTSGEFINANVDLVITSEAGAATIVEEFQKIRGPRRVFDPAKIIVISDHFTPNRDISAAAVSKMAREFASEQGLPYYEVGRGGICHVVLAERGLIVPGDLVVGCDSHTCTNGALGAFCIGVGATDAAVACDLGEIWLKVPGTIKLIYNGKPRRWVSGKDLALYTVGLLGAEGARYSALEFTGETVKHLPMADRFTMANMAIETGAKHGVFVPDEKTLAYLRGLTDKPFRVYESDPDATFERVVEIDVTNIEPQVAMPYSPDNVRPISQVGEVAIDQVVIGSCANGRIEDLRVAAQILQGRQVHPRIRMLIFPGSQQVYLQALREGLIETFIQANCAVSTPTCGPCNGGHMGILAAGERCVATTNRNFVGRMGHITSEVYLSGPAIAAASAVAGRIVAPQEIV